MADFGRIQVHTSSGQHQFARPCMPCGAGEADFGSQLCLVNMSHLLPLICTLLCTSFGSAQPRCACTRSALSCQDAVSNASPSSALFSASMPAAAANDVSHLTLQKELKEIERDKASGVSIHVKSGGNLTALTGFVEGDCCLAPCFCPSQRRMAACRSCHASAQVCQQPTHAWLSLLSSAWH